MTACGDTLVERIEHFVFGARAGRHCDVDVEDASDDGRRIEYLARDVGESLSRRRSMIPVTTDGSACSRSARRPHRPCS